jgi:hypothetical protein
MKAKDFIGTKQKLKGYVFSMSEELDEEEYNVIDAKQVPLLMIDTTTLEETNYYAVNLLLKRSGMKRAKWTRKIPLRRLNK